MGRFSDGLSGLLAFAFIVASFALWCYGVAVCWRAGEFFWAVVSFAAAPVGFLIGLYNFIF